MPKKSSKKNRNEKDSINYKKLFFELMLVLSVVFVGVLAIIYPLLRDHGAFENHTYDIFDELIYEVDHYDYSKGRDLDLEKRLSDGWLDDTNANKQFYYGIASATYYCHIGYYNSSQNYFDLLYEMIPQDSEKPKYDLETHEVICDRILKDKAKDNK